MPLDLDTRISSAMSRTWNSLLPRGVELPWNTAVYAASEVLGQSNGIDMRHIRIFKGEYL